MGSTRERCQRVGRGIALRIDFDQNTCVSVVPAHCRLSLDSSRKEIPMSVAAGIALVLCRATVPFGGDLGLHQSKDQSSSSDPSDWHRQDYCISQPFRLGQARLPRMLPEAVHANRVGPAIPHTSRWERSDA